MNQLQLWGIAGVVALVAINVLVYGGPKAMAWLKSRKAGKAKPASNDAGPPAGAVEWVQQLVDAAGGKAEPEFVLQHLRSGSTAAVVMADRIRRLEGAPTT